MKSDQSNKADASKAKMYLLYQGLALPLYHVACVLSYGAEKYEPSGWKKVEKERYWDALYRHLNAFHLGEKADKESGLHHLAHAACNMLFIAYFELKDYPISKFTVWNKPPTDHKVKNNG